MAKQATKWNSKFFYSPTAGGARLLAMTWVRENSGEAIRCKIHRPTDLRAHRRPPKAKLQAGLRYMATVEWLPRPEGDCVRALHQ